MSQKLNQLIQSDNNKCFCIKPNLITTPIEGEIICKNCGVVIGYDDLHDIKNRVDVEHLTAYTYNYDKFYNKKPKRAGLPITISGEKRNLEREVIFELRLIPAVKKPFENAIGNYFNTSKLTGDYKIRKPLPFLVLNNDEMPLFIHLPDAVTTKNLQTSRNISLPSKLTSKKGFNLGYIEESKTCNQYGIAIKSTDEECAVISPIDFSRHGYFVGGTGAVKTIIGDGYSFLLVFIALALIGIGAYKGVTYRVLKMPIEFGMSQDNICSGTK